MSLLHFDRNIAGAKTIWILQFNYRKPAEKSDWYVNPQIDFIIPAPTGGNNWMRALSKKDKEALKRLNSIQELCNGMKKECEKEVAKSDVSKSEEKDVAKKINNLEEMIKRFNELIKRLQNPSE